MTSIVGGALERIFQTLRDEIDHPLPPYTAVVWKEEYSPNSTKAKTRTKRCTSVAPVPGRTSLPPAYGDVLEGAYIGKFAQPSDDLHHLSCLSFVRAYCGGTRRPSPAGTPYSRVDKANSAFSL